MVRLRCSGVCKTAWWLLFFVFYCYGATSACWSANAHHYPHMRKMPIPLIWDPKVFGIDTVYQSRNIHPLSSVHRPANSCLRACRGPELIFPGFVWFLVLNFTSVCKEMEDSCQCRGICLCHSLPSPIPVSLSFFVSHSSSASSFSLFLILSPCRLHEASKNG